MISTMNRKQGLNQRVRFAKPPFTEWCKLVRYVWCKRRVPNKTNMILESLIRALKSPDGAKESENVWKLLKDIFLFVKGNNEKIIIKSTLLDCLCENIDGNFSLLVLECLSLLFDTVSRSCLAGLFDQIGKILCKVVNSDDYLIEKVINAISLSQRHKGVTKIMEYVCQVLKVVFHLEDPNERILSYLTSTILTLQFKDNLLQQSKSALVTKFKDCLVEGNYTSRLLQRLPKEFCEKYNNRKGQEEFLAIIFDISLKKIGNGKKEDLQSLITLLRTYSSCEIVPECKEIWIKLLQLERNNNWFECANILYELDHSKANLKDILPCFEPHNAFDTENNFYSSVISTQWKLRRLPKFFISLLELEDINSSALKYLGNKLEESTSNICLDCWKVCLNHKNSFTKSSIKLLSTVVEYFIISDKLLLQGTNVKLVEIMDETRERIKSSIGTEENSLKEDEIFIPCLKLLYALTNLQFLLSTTLDVSYEPEIKKEKSNFSFSLLKAPWKDVAKHCQNSIEGRSILANFSILKSRIAKHFSYNDSEKIIRNSIEFIYELTLCESDNDIFESTKKNFDLIYPYMSKDMKENFCNRIIENENLAIISKAFEYKELHTVLFSQVVKNLTETLKGKKTFKLWNDHSIELLKTNNTNIKSISEDILNFLKVDISNHPKAKSTTINILTKTMNLLLDFPFESLESDLKLKFALLYLLYSALPLDKSNNATLLNTCLKGLIKVLDTKEASDLWKYLQWNKVLEYLQSRFLKEDYSFDLARLLKQVSNVMIISLAKSEYILSSKQTKEFFKNQVASLNELKNVQSSNWVLAANYTSLELFLSKTLSFSKRHYLKGEKKKICSEFYESLSIQSFKILENVLKSTKCSNCIDCSMNILAVCLQSKEASKYAKKLWELAQKSISEKVEGTLKYLKCLSQKRDEFDITEDWLIENWLVLVKLIIKDLRVVNEDVDTCTENLIGIISGLPKEYMLKVVQHIIQISANQSSRRFQLHLLQNFLNKERSLISTTSPAVVTFMESCCKGNSTDQLEVMKTCTVIMPQVVKREIGSRILRIIEVILEGNRSSEFYSLACRSVQLAVSGNSAPPYLIVNTLSCILENLMKENMEVIQSCKENFEKACAILSKPNFLRVSVQLIAAYCMQGGSSTGPLSNAIYHVMDLLEGKDMGLLRINLPPAALTLFLSLSEEFERNFRYTGKV
ncbi:DgyrCDS9045 [Dimorphilus gyrociliatus]|uniref:DgyrCDS9045 n=1 Tax=Dimorphilus gyrociliatus TaxID=2664684 RepID=A0A7I8VX69_9ANNE|nr:DgyrCDS9045 [Dimorphilus gyrociliatus]